MSVIKKKTILYHILAAVITLAGLSFVLWRANLYPFGSDTILRIDLGTQYVDFIMFFNNSTLREKLYSFSKGFGGPVTGLIAYYALSPFNLILQLFRKNMEMAVFLTVAAKFVFMGQGAYRYLNRHFEDKKINLVFMMIYTFYPYFIRYYFNVIWMDCFALLPFLLLMTENVIDGKGRKGFIILYTYALLANYYIAYMLSIFIRMYFFWYSVMKCRYSLKYTVQRTITMASCVAISFMLVSPVLLPTAYQLFSGKLSDSMGFGRTKPMFNILTIFLAFFDGAHFVDSLPVFAAGVCTVFLLFAFFLSPKSRNSEDIGLGLMLAVLAASMYFPLLYLVWHGFSWPVGFAPRSTCAYAIVFMIICRKSVGYLDSKAAVRTLVPVVPLYMACAVFFMKTPHLPWSRSILFATILSLTVSVFAFVLMLKNEKLAKNLFCTAMAVLIVINSSIHMNRERAFQTVESDRLYNYEANMALIDYAKSQIDDDGFYRMEDLQSRVFNQPMGAGYYGVNHFSSTYDLRQLEMFEHFGYQSSFYSTIYTCSNPVTDSLFGIKYLLSKNADNSPAGYVMLAEGEKNVYYNPNHFPMAFVGNTARIDYSDDWKQHVNNMTAALTGYTVTDAAGNIDFDSLRSVAEILQANAAKVISHDGCKLEFAASGNYLLTTIMYDDCWQIEVDGIAVRPEKFMEYFIAVPLNSTDTCNVTMTYVPQGFIAGVALMTLAIVIIMINCYISYKNKRGI